MPVDEPSMSEPTVSFSFLCMCNNALQGVAGPVLAGTVSAQNDTKIDEVGHVSAPTEPVC